MTTTHDLPTLVEAYLDDLDRALASAEPRERAETVAAVRDHAAELTTRYGTDDAAARRMLTELGPVDAIAASATPAPAPVVLTAPAAPKVDAVDIVLPIITVLLVFLAPITLVWAIVRLARGAGSRALQWLTIVLALLPTGFLLVIGFMHLTRMIG